MRLLLRLAFWLGVVICYLPAADPQHQAPGTGGAVQSVTEDRSQMPSVSRRLPCDPSRKLSASLRGQPNGRAPRSEKVSQNTLTPCDLAPAWQSPMSRREQ